MTDRNAYSKPAVFWLDNSTKEKTWAGFEAILARVSPQLELVRFTQWHEAQQEFVERRRPGRAKPCMVVTDEFAIPFAKKVKADAPGIPVVQSSLRTSQKKADEHIGRGIVDRYVHKLDFDSLEAVIAAFWKQSQLGGLFETLSEMPKSLADLLEPLVWEVVWNPASASGWGPHVNRLFGMIPDADASPSEIEIVLRELQILTQNYSKTPDDLEVSKKIDDRLEQLTELHEQDREYLQGRIESSFKLTYDDAMRDLQTARELIGRHEDSARSDRSSRGPHASEAQAPTEQGD